MNPDRHIQGICTDYTHDGKGVIKHEGLPIFVPYLLMGEEAEIVITNHRDHRHLRRMPPPVAPDDWTRGPVPLHGRTGSCTLAGRRARWFRKSEIRV